MSDILSDSVIAIPCPNCNRETKKTIAWLKTHKQMTCAGCKGVFDLKTKRLFKGLDEASASVDSFMDTVRDLGK